MIDKRLYQPEYNSHFTLDHPMDIKTRSFPHHDSIRLHHHPSLEVNYFHRTSGLVWINSKRFDLENVYCIILPPWTVHRYEITPCPGSVKVVQISLAHLGQWIHGNAVSAFLSDPGCTPVIIPDDERDLVPRVKGDTTMHAVSYLFEIMQLLEARSKNSSLSGNIDWLVAVLEYSEKNMEKRISVADVASISGMSRALFAKRFQEHTGQSYHQFLLELRLERAVDLLDGGSSVTEAALESGFFDASHLTRYYKEVHGHTPGKRKSLADRQ